MLEILAGSMIASPYAKRKLTGFNLPLISKLTTHTRATVIAHCAFNIFQKTRSSDLITLDSLRTNLFLGDIELSDYDICACILSQLSFYKGKGLMLPAILNSLESKSIEAIMIAVCEISYSLNNGFSSDFILSDFTKNHMGGKAPTMLDFRNSITQDNIHASLAVGIISALTSSNYEKAIRNSLYVGGCRELAMMTIGLILAKRGIPVPVNISCFCRAYLANNKLALQ